MKIETFKAPPYLKKGDTVGCVALASKVKFQELKLAFEILESWGLNIEVGNSVFAENHTFAGSDELRLSDFQAMLNNPNIKAIFSARGGYGSSRIIDAVDFIPFLKSPKWIIGFSDITALHGKIQSMGFQSIHGPMPKTMGWDTFSDQTLKKTLFGKMIDYQTNTNYLNRVGEATGNIIGGNLAILTHCIGTNSDVDYSGKILFIEDIGEYFYTIDRMMVQLKRAGKLDNLAGLIVGQFSDCKENSEPFGKTVYEIVAEHTAQSSYPIAFDFPIGHTAENFAIRCGESIQLRCTNEKVQLRSFKAVV